MLVLFDKNTFQFRELIAIYIFYINLTYLARRTQCIGQKTECIKAPSSSFIWSRNRSKLSFSDSSF